MYNHGEGIATPNCAIRTDVVSQRRKERQGKTNDFDLPIKIICLRVPIHKLGISGWNVQRSAFSQLLVFLSLG
jgi:hypothetical protein